MHKLVLPLIAVVAFFTPIPIQAEASPLKSPSEFSMEMVTKVGEQNISTKMFKSQDKTRVESSVQGMDSVSIMREDLKKMYMIMPAQKMYMETEINPAMAAGDLVSPRGDMKWEKLGSETVSEVACDKYKVTTTVEGKATEVFYYVDSRGFPVRTEMAANGSTIVVDYKNWKEGPQDASLFEVPAGYSKMPGMGGN